MYPVHVAGMNMAELKEISTKVENFLAENDVKITFDNSAKEKLAMISGGFPWFVHVIGQDSLINAYDNNIYTITGGKIETSVSRLAENRYAKQCYDLYFKSVRDSQPREVLLRLLAKWNDDNIPLSDIYPMARSLKLSNPSALKNQLMKQKYGKVIFSPEGHQRGLVRFHNKMFKRYINLRDSIYIGVAASVNEEWKKR